MTPVLKPGFPIWMYLKPLQARNVAYCNRMRPPAVSSASEFFSFFFPAAPVSGFLSLDSRPFKLLGRASCPLCALPRKLQGRVLARLKQVRG